MYTYICAYKVRIEVNVTYIRGRWSWAWYECDMWYTKDYFRRHIASVDYVGHRRSIAWKFWESYKRKSRQSSRTRTIRTSINWGAAELNQRSSKFRLQNTPGKVLLTHSTSSVRINWSSLLSFWFIVFFSLLFFSMAPWFENFFVI